LGPDPANWDAINQRRPDWNTHWNKTIER